jgi:UDP-N-acetylglucosamine acyltransferase
VKVHSSAVVDPSAQLADDVIIGPFCIVHAGAKLGPGSILDSHVVIHGCVTAGSGNRFHQGSAIGDMPQDVTFTGEDTSLVIGDNNIFREFTTIHRGTHKDRGVTKIGNNNLFMAYSHIAHDCIIGNNVSLTNTANLAGHTIIDDFVYLSAFVGIHQRCRIGAYSFIGANTTVTKDIVPYALAVGHENNRAKIYGHNVIGLKRAGFSKESLSAIRKAFRILFRSKLNTTQAVERIVEEFAERKEIKLLTDFIRNSERGIAK